jgi:Uri superfamily endonuclease
MKGSYILLMELSEGQEIWVGRLGSIFFCGGFYAYVGSAMNGLDVRLARHLRREKKSHWHIDYLLKQAVIREIVLYPSESKVECSLSLSMAGEFQHVPGFGSSDCHCASHLYFGDSLSRLRAGATKAGWPELKEPEIRRYERQVEADNVESK